jgi:hypothetical protein
MEEAETANTRERWDKLVEIVQLAFEGKPLPSSFGMGILVLIPKGEPDQFRGIALLEVAKDSILTQPNTLPTAVTNSTPLPFTNWSST